MMMIVLVFVCERSKMQYPYSNIIYLITIEDYESKLKKKKNLEISFLFV